MTAWLFDALSALRYKGMVVIVCQYAINLQKVMGNVCVALSHTSHRSISLAHPLQDLVPLFSFPKNNVWYSSLQLRHVQNQLLCFHRQFRCPVWEGYPVWTETPVFAVPQHIDLQ